MPKPEQISGAAVPMKIGNKTYQARALSDKDYDELHAYCRFKFIEEGKESINSMPLTKESRQEMLTALLLASASVSFNSAEGSRIINLSNEGVSRVGWQMVKVNHPQLSIEEFTEEVVGDESQSHLMSTLSSIHEVFIYLNIGSSEDNGSEAEGDSDSDEKSD
jgi:hypothetical protein